MIPALPALSVIGSVLDSAAVSRPSQATGDVQASAAAGADFGQVLASVSADAVNSLKTGEATSIAGLQGKASVQQVVESVMSAEQSLHTAVAIRDKLVSAYQSLTQMAI